MMAEKSNELLKKTEFMARLMVRKVDFSAEKNKYL
jgi:hypothetical protein